MNNARRPVWRCLPSRCLYRWRDVRGVLHSEHLRLAGRARFRTELALEYLAGMNLAPAEYSATKTPPVHDPGMPATT